MYDRTKELTLRMVRAPSISETPDEKAFAGVLEDILREIPYFATHPELVWTSPIAHDPLGRHNVYALVRGKGRNTTILSGHYDVVDIRNYGRHAHLAFQPELLQEALIRELESRPRSEAEERALTDLLSGDFLPARGALDMKSGLAAGLAVLERFSQLPEQERVGHLLFVAVADEEVSSWGARSAAPELAGLAAKHNLNLLGVINLDATGDNTDGSSGRALYTGTIGKLMLSALVVGVDTHAGYSLDGVNANYLASALAIDLELSPDLTDRSLGIVGTPPTILRQRDLKEQYDVTTPRYAWLCVNVLPHGWNAEEVMNRVKGVAEQSLKEALERLRERAASFTHLPNAVSGTPNQVFTYAELCNLLRKKEGSTFDEARVQFATTLTGDFLEQSARLTRWVWERSGLGGAAVVLGYASVHYPSTALTTEREVAFLNVVRTAITETATQPDEQVTERAVFTGISDMSWFGRLTGDLDAVNSNTPLPAAQIHAPPAGLPCVNLGPWGRDYHQWLERVHQPYSFGVLPRLVWATVLRLNSEL